MHRKVNIALALWAIREFQHLLDHGVHVHTLSFIEKFQALVSEGITPTTCMLLLVGHFK